MGEHEQAAMTVDQLLEQSKLIDIIINAYAESSMTYGDLTVLARACGITMLDLAAEQGQRPINEEKEVIIPASEPVQYTDWNSPTF